MSAATTPAAPTGAQPVAAAPARAYNHFLDLVRTVAILRVLAWHTYGYAWLSYLVASMPAMFFVAGSLMAQSLDRQHPLQVLGSRFRRLLIPLWAFGSVALGIMYVHLWLRPEPGETIHWYQPLFWLFPIWDPQGSNWGVTFWAVLWYMRCLTWLLLLSPILAWLYRRMSFALIGVPLGLLVVFEQRSRSGHPVRWQFEDAALFCIFWLLGFAYNAGTFAAIPTRMRAFMAAVFAAGAALWMLTQDVPHGVVNASYPAHLLVGLTWLFASLTFERPLATFASRGVAARAVGWVNDRAFTIYLWHAAGLFAMYELLWVDDRPRWARDLFALPIVLVVTFACMLAFGWIEDLAARRELHLAPRPARHDARHRPRRLVFVGPVVAGLGVVALFGGIFAEVFRDEPGRSTKVANAVPPSGAGIAIRASRARILDAPPAGPEPTPVDVEAGPVTASDLQELMESWRADYGIAGMTLGIHRGDGTKWAGASGEDVIEGVPIDPGYVYNTASVTKTFTAAMILRMAEEGVIGLDDSVGAYLPGIAHSESYTIRELIQHTSGLMATDAVAPDEALAAATEEDLAFTPGKGFLYSSPGYYMLGLLIEKLTGMSYTQALHEKLLAPLGLNSTLMDEEIAPTEESTHPHTHPALHSSSGVLRTSSQQDSEALPQFDYFGILWSSAGVRSTAADLAAWAIDLWDGDTVVSLATRSQMTSFLPVEFEYAGLATYPFCPCWTDHGKLLAERWGHYGRYGVLEYDPRDRIALAIYTSGTDIDEQIIVAYDELSRRVRELLHNRALQPG